MITNNAVIPCDLDAEQKREIGDLLVQARNIVERVSSVRGGKLAIRDFRRDLYSKNDRGEGKLDVYLTDEDRVVLDRVHHAEGVVISGFFKMVKRIAHQFVLSGRIRMEEDDLVQEGLELILISMMGFNGGHELATYFWNVVARHFLDIAKRQRHDSKNCSLGGIDVAAPFEEEEEEDHGFDMAKLKYAMKCVRFTELEQAVLALVLEGHKNPYTEAASKVKNPATGRPYSRVSAQNAHKSAKDKVARVYELLIRASEAA